MGRLLLFTILFIAYSSASQDVIGLDPLMKEQRVKTKTQYECNKAGKNCQRRFQWTFDPQGRLTAAAEFIDDKPLLTATYSYNALSKIDSVYRQFSYGKKYLSQVYLFDKRGTMTEYYECFEGTACSISERYEYTQNGLLRKKVELRDNKIYAETEYRYDDKGREIEMVFTSGGSQILRHRHSYDQKGNKALTISLSPDGKPLDSTTFKYDSRGLLTHLKWGGGLNTNVAYTYDNLGNEIEYKSMAPDGHVSERRVMTYSGRLVKTRLHYKAKKIEMYFVFEYDLH